MRHVEMNEWRNGHEETNKTFTEAEGNMDFISISIIIISERVASR